MNSKFNILILIIFCLIPVLLLSQGKPYEGPIDPAGDPAMERAGFMNGNRFRMYYQNNSQLSDYPRHDASKWPDDYSGTKLLDVAAVLIGAEVYVTQDSIPVTDLAEVAQLSAQGLIDTLVYIETADYIVGSHAVDFNWDKTVEWALSPVPGYMNIAQDYPAMSNKPDSWPDAWPSAGYSTKWPGEWNGRFGRGIHYADLESYFVANDAQDMENIIVRGDPDENLISEGPRYYPRPGVHIGDFNPDVTTQRGFPWGGLGLRVEVRGYQWNNPEARDIIFWEYNIANISDYALPTCGFGYFIDPSIGGDTGGDGETASFDKLIDLTYIWEITGIGGGGLPTGVFGMAYLESPGNWNDDIDNDDDGLLNERRDNDAGQIIGATEGIYDLQKFLDFYNYKLDELRPHYEGDEDQDWQDGNDVNGNGTYSYYNAEAGFWMLEPGEYAGDDVGLDGVAPTDLNYTGPDEGECNNKPDYVLGVGCEPNYNATDVAEADQIGLTSQVIMDHDTWTPTYQNDKDENVWSLMKSSSFNEYASSMFIFEFFASAVFPFYKGSVERISIAMLAAYDELAGLNSSSRDAPTLFKKKGHAQIIYERDYRFAQPPEMPTLRAIPGDNKVTLIWDDVADKYTREPLLSRENDFEGYKLYRSTDKLFQDPEIITNAQGIKSFKKPIFQCDKVDSIEGYAQFAANEGTQYYLGSDNGITHHFIDEDVINGKTYYYALAAYDYGIERFQISPTENNITVELDESENIIRMGQNVQVVTPRSKAAGYVPPNVHIDEQRTSKLIHTGEIVPEIFINEDVKADHIYRVTFRDDTVNTYISLRSRYHHPMDVNMTTSALYVYDESDNNKLVYSETPGNGSRNIIHYTSLWEDEDTFDYYAFSEDEINTDVFDGISLKLKLSPIDTSYLDINNSGWITGSSDMTLNTGSVSSFFPWDYDIIFTDTISTHGKEISTSSVKNIDNTSIVRTAILTDQGFNFYVINKNSIDSSGQYEKLDMVVYDINENGVFDWNEDEILVGHTVASTSSIRWAGSVFSINFWNVVDESGLPKAGDLYQVRFIRPLSSIESFVFSVSSEKKIDTNAIKTAMDSIRVVPNPYIATNTMESAVGNQYLNQGRRIMFTHLPAECIIQIFTPTGLPVDKIEVNNAADNGMAHWDLLTREGLEVASGMYVYVVKCKITGRQKAGKFAIIK